MTSTTTTRTRGASNVSAIERLRSLPAFFRATDLTVRFDWSTDTASQYLWRWRRAGLVEPFGTVSNTYANLVANPSPEWERALVMTMPSACIIGIECMRRAGWVTQIEARPEVAVLQSARAYATPHFTISRRPEHWFVAMAEANAFDTATPGLARSLKPGAALVDMVKHASWHGGIDPDDVYWSEVHAADRQDIARTMTALRVDDSVLKQLVASPGPTARSMKP